MDTRHYAGLTLAPQTAEPDDGTNCSLAGGAITEEYPSDLRPDDVHPLRRQVSSALTDGAKIRHAALRFGSGAIGRCGRDRSSPGELKPLLRLLSA